MRYILLLSVLFYACSTSTGPNSKEPEKSGFVNIVNWEQPFSQADGYGEVKVEYEITNTSQYTIDYYQVYIRVRCTDGAVYENYTNGGHLTPSNTRAGELLVDTTGKKASEVFVGNVSYE